MGKEIERKYLVNLNTWQPQGEGIHFKQGYLNSQKESNSTGRRCETFIANG